MKNYQNLNRNSHWGGGGLNSYVQSLKKNILLLSLIAILCFIGRVSKAQNVPDGDFECQCDWTVTGTGWLQGTLGSHYHSSSNYASFAASASDHNYDFNASLAVSTITTNPGLYIPLDATSVIITFYSYIVTQETTFSSDILHVHMDDGTHNFDSNLDAFVFQSTGYVQQVVPVSNFSHFLGSTISNLSFEAVLDVNSNYSIFRIDDVDIQFTTTPFILATNTHDQSITGISPISGITNTGNDAKNGMNVWVADGTFSRLAWDDGINSGTVQLNAGHGVKDAKVALIDNGTTWYALVVYYNSYTNNKYAYELYEWISTAFVLQGSAITLQTTSFNKGINIKADEAGNSVIVWDDLTTGIQESDVYLVTGVPTTPSAYTTIYADINSVLGFSAPDVSLYNTGTTTADAYITFVADEIGVGRNVNVDLWPFSSGLYPNFSNTTTVSPIQTLAYADGYYDYPRIASPNSTSCYQQSGWTVVFEYNDTYMGNPAEYHIAGTTFLWDDNTYTPYHVWSNDYTFFSECNNWEIEGDVNERPVVTYSDFFNGADFNANPYGDGNDIMVGWQYTPTYPTPIPFLGTEPIILMCDNQGFFHDCDTNAMLLPYNPNSITTGFQGYLSLSGREDGSDNIFYTWFSGVASDIMYKGEPYYNYPLRREHISIDTKQGLSCIYPNPTNGDFTINFETEPDEQISLEIYNLFGERIYISKDVSPATSFVKTISLNDQHSGIYFVRETGKLYTNIWKLVLTK